MGNWYWIHPYIDICCESRNWVAAGFELSILANFDTLALTHSHLTCSSSKVAAASSKLATNLKKCMKFASLLLRSRATMKNKYTKTLRVRDSVDMVWVKLGNGLGNTFPLRSLWTFLGRFHRSFQVSNQFGNLCRPSQKCVGEGLEAIKLLMLDG